MMRDLILILLALLLYISCANQAEDNPPMEGFNAAGSDSRAVEIADDVMSSMGGRSAWDQTRYLSWSFFADDQIWDKWTGRFRWQRDSTVVLMNLESRHGDAWQNGLHVTDTRGRDSLLLQAYRNWINSSYWLLMPYKLKDSGVTLRYEGAGIMEDGRAAEVLSLTFKDVGMTPDNRYEVFIDTETMLVGQWSYYASSDDPEPKMTYPWLNWQRHGAILLSDDRGMRPDGSSLILPNVAVFDDLPAAIFENPGKLDLAQLPAIP